MSTLKIAGLAAVVLAAGGGAALLGGGKYVDSKTAALLEELQTKVPGLELKNEVSTSSLFSRTGRLFVTYHLPIYSPDKTSQKAASVPLQLAADYEYSFSPAGTSGTFTKAADWGNFHYLNFAGDFKAGLSDLQSAQIRIDPLNLNSSGESFRRSLKLGKSILNVSKDDSGKSALCYSFENPNVILSTRTTSGSQSVEIKNLHWKSRPVPGQLLNVAEGHMTLDSLTLKSWPPEMQDAARSGDDVARMPPERSAGAAERSYTLTGIDNITGIRDVDSSGLGILYLKGSVNSIKENLISGSGQRLLPEFTNSRYDLTLAKIAADPFMELQYQSLINTIPEKKLRELFPGEVTVEVKNLHTEINSEKFDGAGTLQISPNKPPVDAVAEFKLSASEKLLKSISNWQGIPEEWLQKQLDEAVSAGFLTRKEGSCETTLSLKERHLYLNNLRFM